MFGSGGGRSKLQAWLGLRPDGRVSVPRDSSEAQQLLNFVDDVLGGEDRRSLESAWDVLRAMSQARHHAGSRAAHRLDAEDRIDSGDARLSLDAVRRRREAEVGRWLQTDYPAPLITELEVSSYFRLASDKTNGTTPPYVRRSGDGELGDRLRTALDSRPSDWEQRVVVLGGPAKAGKTRSLIEALQREPALQAAEILIPMPPSSGGSSDSAGRIVLEELASALDRAESAGLLSAAFVIFIDDLHRHFIESGSRNVQAALQSLVNRPQAPVVLASVSDAFLELDDPAGDRIGVPRAHRAWLRERAISWPARFDAGEEADASVVFEHQLRKGVLGTEDLLRLPAALAAVPELVGRIEHARSDRAQLPRSALVTGALDAVILDPDGLTVEELRRATEQRFTLSAPTRPPLSATQWQDALEWGTDGIGDVWAILDRGVAGLDSEPRWRLMDALSERLLPGHEIDDALLDGLEERQYDNLVRHTYEAGDVDHAMFLARKGRERVLPAQHSTLAFFSTTGGAHSVRLSTTTWTRWPRATR